MDNFDFKASLPLYDRIISLLQEVKLVNGNLALNQTLSNHKGIKRYLINYQKKLIIDLERELNPEELE